MPRRPSILLSAASLVPCLVVCVLWAVQASGQFWILRYAPADGRVFGMMADLRGGGGAADRLRLVSVAPLPHPCLTTAFVGRGLPKTLLSMPNNPHALPGRWSDTDVVIDLYDADVEMAAASPGGVVRPVALIGTARVWAVSVPFWMAAVLFGLPAVPLAGSAWRRHRQHQQRARLGRCAGCGYDLRATPERCPECGKVPTARGAA